MKSVIFLLAAALALGMASCGDTGSQGNDGRYTVTYHENGQSVTVPLDQEAAAGTMVYVSALPGGVPAGKVFDGWNTKEDGSGDFYGPGAPLVVNQNIDLYAEWATSGGGDETVEYTVAMEPISNFDIYIDYHPQYVWGKACLPDWDGERIVSGGSYTVTYSFKSDKAITLVNFRMADASGVTGKNVVLLDGSGNGDFQWLYIEPNTQVSGEFRFLSTSNAANSLEQANSIFVIATMSAIDQQPTLTFTELTLHKDEIVNIVSVNANGSPGARTSQLTFTFDKPVTGLTASNFGVGPSSIWSGYISITKGTLSGSGWIYTLDIDLNSSVSDSGITEVTINTNVSKLGYAFKGNTQTSEHDRNGAARTAITAYTGIAPPPPPPPRVVFNSVTANGSFFQDTTELTLTFSEQIEGLTLTASDIIAGGVYIIKGILRPGSSPGTYILPITVPDTGGTLRVSVSKTGYTISGSPKTTTIYRAYNNTPLYTGFLGRGYHVLKSEYYKAGEVKAQYALDMRRLIAEGRHGKNFNGVSSVEVKSIVGESLREYAEQFSSNVGVSGGIGLFSASVSFGYSSSKKAVDYESFASCIATLTKEKHYVDMSQISLADIREEYLNPTFKNEYLLNNSVAPDKLFDNYGTHIFLVVYLGGRMDMSFIYHNSSNESAQAITAHLEASYATVKGTADISQQNQTTEFRNNSEDRVKSYGGTVGLDFTDFVSAKANYTNWASSIESRLDPTIVRGGDLGAELEMIPIWELVDKTKYPARYNALVAEYNKQINENNNKIMGSQTPVSKYMYGVYMGYGGSIAAARSNLLDKNTTPQKSMKTVIPGDLNHGVSNQKYVMYLGFTRTDNASEAITDIIAVNVNGTSTPSATKTINGIPYTRFGDDANKGTGGDHIWLYYTRDTRAGTPIRDLFVEHNYNDTGRVGETGWTRVKWADSGSLNEQGAQMNKGAGGSTIYVYIQR